MLFKVEYHITDCYDCGRKEYATSIVSGNTYGEAMKKIVEYACRQGDDGNYIESDLDYMSIEPLEEPYDLDTVYAFKKQPPRTKDEEEEARIDVRNAVPLSDMFDKNGNLKEEYAIKRKTW